MLHVDDADLLLSEVLEVRTVGLFDEQLLKQLVVDLQFGKDGEVGEAVDSDFVLVDIFRFFDVVDQSNLLEDLRIELELVHIIRLEQHIQVLHLVLFGIFDLLLQLAEGDLFGDGLLEVEDPHIGQFPCLSFQVVLPFPVDHAELLLVHRTDLNCSIFYDYLGNAD